nr:hypothetical protein [Tanacetum cinerariifolium]
GFLDEEIYMEQPECFVDPDHPRKRYRTDGSKRGAIPMQVDCHLDKSQCAESKDDKARMQNVPYASAVGSIMYVVRYTRPDVVFVQYITSRFQQSPVVWKSSKQSTTVQHAAEAEYIAAAEAAKEAVWIRKFVDELGVVPSNNYPIEMNCDNNAAISMAKEPGVMKGATHFKRKFHYVHDNLADPFTKALAGPKLTRHSRSMGLRPASSF